MARASRWWKCDLQVATPGGGFDCGITADRENGDDHKTLVDVFVSALVQAGVEVVALADHNDASWAAEIKTAAEIEGVTAFPGMELTTGTGSDGIHLVLIGDPTRTKDDFDAILYGCCGFTRDGQHPLFDRAGPAPAPTSLSDLLDQLPDGYLVVAPHALTENGIASATSATGAIRWKALHHDRLNALDVGDPRTATGSSTGFNAKFRRRELDNFPCLRHLAFVSTSDAYAVPGIGSRFTWVRMAGPTLEGLRQAFLDHSARIICDWDPRVTTFSDPNEVRHAWIEKVSLDSLWNGDSSVEVEFDPHLNVIIGGRGSGKSTVVAALRQLYSSFEGLPPSVKNDAEQFALSAFADASLSASHHLAISDVVQRATWTNADGPQTVRDGMTTVTAFGVRVVNQKELFERAASDPADRFAASRNLLKLVDESIGVYPDDPAPESFSSKQALAREVWMREASALHRVRISLKTRDSVQARIKELEGQLEAFDSEEARGRRERNDFVLDRQLSLEKDVATVESWLGKLAELIRTAPLSATVDGETDNATTLASLVDEYREKVRTLESLVMDTRQSLLEVTEGASEALEKIREALTHGAWVLAVGNAQQDSAAYEAELSAKGLSPGDYQAIRDSLNQERNALQNLELIASGLVAQQEKERRSWTDFLKVHQELTAERRTMLAGVAERSALLKFTVSTNGDFTHWLEEVRSLGGFRSDAYLEDMPKLAQWLWEEDSSGQVWERFMLWRDCLIAGDLTRIRAQIDFRGVLKQRLEALDETIRSRIAATLAEDTVTMWFLRDGGDPETDLDWQPVTAGSPGQRSAAMLSFILHHGTEPLVLDQPEDDLDTAWISELIVRHLRTSRWSRQLIIVTHNANIPVNGDADRVIVMENAGGRIAVRMSPSAVSVNQSTVIIHSGPIEIPEVRADIQEIMEGGVAAFVSRERKYNNELSTYRAALRPPPPDRALARPAR
jgi:energy-coupling factor transporter ATP-binding protein EcfA2